jgi:hypothetical protein
VCKAGVRLVVYYCFMQCLCCKINAIRALRMLAKKQGMNKMVAPSSITSYVAQPKTASNIDASINLGLDKFREDFF